MYRGHAALDIFSGRRRFVSRFFNGCHRASYPTLTTVAVGTSVTGCPPHRSVRAHFSAYGSYLGCLASNRTPGSGCSIRGREQYVVEYTQQGASPYRSLGGQGTFLDRCLRRTRHGARRQRRRQELAAAGSAGIGAGGNRRIVSTAKTLPDFRCHNVCDDIWSLVPEGRQIVLWPDGARKPADGSLLPL